MDLLKLDYKKRERIFGLDLIRAFAIIMVVVAHGNAIMGDLNIWIIDGVDLFFVLSGFLIGHILIKSFNKEEINKNTLFTFWKRRWFRTLPNYYLILVLCLVYTYSNTGYFGEFSFDFIVFIQNFRKSHPLFMQVAWSLAVEEWFYILFPITMYFGRKILPFLTLKRTFLLTIGLFLLIPLLYRIKYGAVFYTSESASFLWENLFRKTVIARLDTIAYGVLGSYIYFNLHDYWTKYKNSMFFLGIALLYFAENKLDTGFLHFSLFFNVSSIGILLLLPLLNSIRSAPDFISTPITYISLCSYSIYLIHYSLILKPILYHVIPYYEIDNHILFVFYLSATFILSLLNYKYFELPILKLRDMKVEITKKHLS